MKSKINIRGSGGKEETSDVSEGKEIKNSLKRFNCSEVELRGLYFGAGWCSNCVEFTPKLIDYYEYINSSNERKKFEILFIGRDNE